MVLSGKTISWDLYKSMFTLLYIMKKNSLKGLNPFESVFCSRVIVVK